MADALRLVKRISDLEPGNYEADKNNAYFPASVGAERTYKYPLGAAEAAANQYTDEKIQEAIENLPPPPSGEWLPNTTGNPNSTGVTDDASVAVKQSADLNMIGSAQLNMNGNADLNIVDGAQMNMAGSANFNMSGGSNFNMSNSASASLTDSASLNMNGGSKIKATQGAYMEYRSSLGASTDDEYQDLPALPFHYGTYAVHISSDQLDGYIIAVNKCGDNLYVMSIKRADAQSNWQADTYYNGQYGWKPIAGGDGSAGGGESGGIINQNQILTLDPSNITWTDDDGNGNANGTDGQGKPVYKRNHIAPIYKWGEIVTPDILAIALLGTSSTMNIYFVGLSQETFRVMYIFNEGSNALNLCFMSASLPIPGTSPSGGAYLNLSASNPAIAAFNPLANRMNYVNMGAGGSMA